MKYLLKENICLALMRRSIPPNNLTQVLAVDSIADINFYAYQSYFFPLYLYPDKHGEQLFDNKAYRADRMPNFTSEFLKAIKESLELEPTPEEIFYYIYAVLYSSLYRKRYE